MDGYFEIVTDRDTGVARTRMGGFFDDAAFDRYLTARHTYLSQLGCGPGRHLSIVDIREMSIQAQDLVARFGAALDDPAYRGRRTAFVVSATLARMQLLRILGGRQGGCYQCFTDLAEAEKWVLTEPDAAELAA